MATTQQQEATGSFNTVLQELRALSSEPRTRGTLFENLMKKYFLTDPIYRNRFKQVYTWAECPDTSGSDEGIDLVAITHDDERCAIQCKFYAEDHRLQKGDIDSFFTASGKTLFKERIIVSTTDSWSEQAERALKGQDKVCDRIGLANLQNSKVVWSKLRTPDKLVRVPPQELFKHQKEALKDVLAGFQHEDVGQLIMACGTGKTFTSLRIAEEMVPNGSGNILFLVPSLSLLSQSLREWSANGEIPQRNFAVCSDAKVGNNEEDIRSYDLEIPATTDAKKLADKLKQSTASSSKANRRNNVVFGTYQSIEVVIKAQQLGAPEFDLVICDEAHRTVGYSAKERQQSYFTLIHDKEKLKAKKRLYMTATSRIFAPTVKKKVETLKDIELFSMDDKNIFGNEFHRLNFAKAVEEKLLSDYKVLILTVTDKNAANTIKDITGKEIELSDAAKIIGCWNGLAKRLSDPNALPENERTPMKRAVAYTGRIDTSKQVKDLFNQVIQEYHKEHEEINDDALKCKVDHTDGTENSMVRNTKLNWLKEDTGDNECRILSNARCLSEGVDVPALDAVIFLSPRKSKIDIVQSVGRVMRRSSGKNMGYIILPVFCNTDVPPEEALNNNDTYNVVWETIQAIRSHDERMDAEINKIELNKKPSGRILIDMVDASGVGGKDTDATITMDAGIQLPLPLHSEKIRETILATLVMKCGTRRYWQNWAEGVANISQNITSRINSLVVDTTSKHHQKFKDFHNELKHNLNPAITAGEAVEMLAQHIITAPVFNALFESYSFVKNNPVSQSLDKFLATIEYHNLAAETKELEKFFNNVQSNVAGIDNLEGKQKIITELYENFFKKTFKKQADRLGIVYTPVEVVDFILNSTNDLLHKHFDKRLTSKGVNILDPFTGTGTFISRLLQLGLISKQDLSRKYASELHANEIVLLAYYIAAINIEQTYHFCLQERAASTEGIKEGETQKQQTQNSAYQQFPGIILTDTFQLNEDTGDYFKEAEFLQINPEQIKKQKKLPIMVIVGNPPYSAGQNSQNDNNPNLKYPVLDERIRTTYVAHSTAQLKRKIYDSYVRAIRWATDRIKDEGMVAFVTNGNFLDSKSMDGLRHCLPQELTHIYCFNLRGGSRHFGANVKKEGESVFKQGSRATITINFLIKAPKDKGTPPGIYYHKFDDYLSRNEKLKELKEIKSVNNIKWQEIQPDKNNDWINQRDPKFNQYMPMGSEDSKSYFIKNLKHSSMTDSIFGIYSAGLATNRDAWVYNYNKQEVIKNMQSCIKFYNTQRQDFYTKHAEKINNLNLTDKISYVKKFIRYDSKKIHWDRNNKKNLAESNNGIFDESKICIGLYRPFSKQYLYFDKQWNNCQYKLPKLFPKYSTNNYAICISKYTTDFSVMMINIIPDLNAIGATQCFPRYCYNPSEADKDDLLSQSKDNKEHDQEQRIDNISPKIVELFQQQYKDNNIDADAVFYYVYGILHSPSYRSRYTNNLSKDIPHIPYAASKKDFWLFSEAGKQLSNWHINYEKHNAEPNIQIIEAPDLLGKDKDFYRIEKMKFGGSPRTPDKNRIIYNHNITITGIPPQAYEYEVSGKSPLEWLLERYQVTIDTGTGGRPGSGIKNDPNDWSDNPRYILDLIPRLAQLSIDTSRVISKLPDIPE